MHPLDSSPSTHHQSAVQQAFILPAEGHTLSRDLIITGPKLYLDVAYK